MSARGSKPETSQSNETIKVRVMADSSVIESVSDGIVRSLGENDGLKLVDRSRPYPCPPPEQEKSRIYLTFGSRVR